MSSFHLGEGSPKPDPVEGQARLYSMKFCPFAQRARLTLTLKKVPHDIVNINLKNKPKWYLEIHPDGKVPAFVTPDGKVIVESDVIVNTLDQMYPEPPLYNEETKSRDLELIDHFQKIIGVFSNCFHGKDNRSLDEIVDEISKYLDEFEEELKSRGTDFFGGDKPGIVDIMIWPWMEKAKALPIIYNTPLNFEKNNFAQLVNWNTNMKDQDFVSNNAGSYETFAKVILAMKQGSIDFNAF